MTYCTVVLSHPTACTVLLMTLLQFDATNPLARSCGNDITEDGHDDLYSNFFQVTLVFSTQGAYILMIQFCRVPGHIFLRHHLFALSSLICPSLAVSGMSASPPDTSHKETNPCHKNPPSAVSLTQTRPCSLQLPLPTNCCQK
jgi:hypothetical protein